MLDQIPQPLKIFAVVLILLTAFACLAYALWPRRDGRTTASRGQSRDTHVRDADTHVRTHVGEDDPDKPPYQPPTPGFPTTAGMRAISKLPGQDRLTRDDRTGMDAETAAISAVPDDHLSGEPPRLRSDDPPLAPESPTARPASSAAPAPPATTAMSAVHRPAVPGSRPHQAPLFPTARQPAPPARETRQQRRERMERLALERADQDRQRDDDRPPEMPSAGS